MIERNHLIINSIHLGKSDGQHDFPKKPHLALSRPGTKDRALKCKFNTSS